MTIHTTRNQLSDFQARRRHDPPLRSSQARLFTLQLVRLCLLIAAFAIAVYCLALQPTTARAADTEFSDFIAALWPDAKNHGVSRATFDDAFAQVSPDKAIIALTRKQAEFVKPVFSYLDGAITNGRISKGKALSEEWSQTLDRIQARFGVDWPIVVGVWGMESNFGANPGNIDTIRALATLAYARYRGDFFRSELLIALKILEHGDIDRSAMRGSWAGAMGQTQFMPSSFEKYAFDFNGLGRRDIWKSTPDALASTANYLKEHGWINGEAWGYEVILPDKFDFADITDKPFSYWSRKGFALATGEALPTSGTASLLLPMGRFGAVFLVTPNFQVIKSYNNSTSYALAVALLGDRISGEGPLKKSWPRKMRLLNRAQSLEMQRALVKMGYKIGELDGKVGDKAKEALREYQKRAGLVPDGFPTLQLLQRMRKPL